MNGKQPVISVNGVSKRFLVPHERRLTLKDHATSLFQRNTFEEFFALRDVSFAVQPGEFFGVIGRNGSGKSTLLKLLANIYQPDQGDVHVSGIVSPFLELGIGFNPELTARENVYLNGVVLGMTRKAIDGCFNDIVEFSELGRFMDQKLKNFSSGMHVRLAFSVAIQVPSSILFVDEVLAVGDADFQKKCYRVFREFKRQKRTILFVTHSLGLVEEFCDRVLLLEQGQRIIVDSPSNAISAYQLLLAGHSLAHINATQQAEQHLTSTVANTNPSSSQSARWGSGDVTIERVQFLDHTKRETNIFSTGDNMRIRIFYNAQKRIPRPVLGFAIFRNEDGTRLCGPNTKTSDHFIDSLQGKGYIDVLISALPFLGGDYDLTVAFYDWDCTTPYDHLEKAYHFTMLPTEKNQYGCIKLTLTWESSPPHGRSRSLTTLSEKHSSPTPGR